MTFIIGTIIGFVLGFTVAAILVAGRAADRDMEWVAYVQEGWQPEQPTERPMGEAPRPPGK